MTKQRKQYSKEFKLEMVKPKKNKISALLILLSKSVSMVRRAHPTH